MTGVNTNKVRTREILTTAKKGWKNISKVLSCTNFNPTGSKRD